MTRQERKIYADLEKELMYRSKLNFSAFALVMYRKHGFRKARLNTVLNECIDSFHECSKTNEKSMVQMCDEETGIELQCGDGKHWYDLPYLNHEVWDKQMPSQEKLIAIMIAEKKWIEAQVNAGILIAMHRLHGWGYERLAQLYADMQEILINEVHFKDKEILELCKSEMGIDIMQYIKKG